MFEKSGNPVLGEKAFGSITMTGDSSQRMTMSGTMNKTGLLMLLVLAGAYYTWTALKNTDMNTEGYLPVR